MKWCSCSGVLFYGEVVEIAGDGGVLEHSLGFGEHVLVAVAAADVGEHELAGADAGGEFGRLAGGEVGELARHVGLLLQVGGLDDQPINAAQQVGEAVGLAEVADGGEAGAGLESAGDHLGGDHAAIWQGDALSLHQLAAQGAGRHTERVGSVREEGLAPLFLEEIAVVVGSAVADTESADA